MPASLISVVIPCYNAERFLATAVGSVLAQTYSHVEILVIDDGSSDASSEVASSFGSAVRLHGLEHTGRPGLVRNYGVKMASGELVAFLDADDYWRAEKLAIQAKLLGERMDAGMVHSNMDVVDGSGRYLRPFFLGCPGSQGLSDDRRESSLEQLVRGDSGVGTPTVLVRRDVLEEAGGFNESLAVGEDWDLWIRLAYSHRVLYVPQALAVHRKHGDNLGLRWVSRGEVPGVELWKGVVRLYPDIAARYPKIIHGKFVIHYLLAALRSLRRGDRRTGMMLLWRTILSNPLKMGWSEWWRNAQKLWRLRRLQRLAPHEIDARRGCTS